MMNHTGSTGQGCAFPCRYVGVNLSANMNYVVKQRAGSARRRQPKSGKMLGKLPPSVPVNAFRSQASLHPFHICSSASTNFCLPFSGSEQPPPVFCLGHATSFAAPLQNISCPPVAPAQSAHCSFATGLLLQQLHAGFFPLSVCQSTSLQRISGSVGSRPRISAPAP